MNVRSLLDSKSVRSTIAFQGAWFALILCSEVFAFLSIVIYLLAHYFFISKDRGLWLISIRVFFVGIMIDSFFVYSHVIASSPVHVASGNFVDRDLVFIPLWLAGLWLCFSFALPVAFKFLQRHYGLCVVLGMIGAPLSYYSGAALRDDVVLMQPTWLALIYIGVAWATLLCLSVFWLRDAEAKKQAASSIGVASSVDHTLPVSDV